MDALSPDSRDGQNDAGAMDARADRRIGQLVDGKYFILRRLACGGMGSVYEARHSVVGRHFALKFLHDHYVQRSSMVQRFLREAQAAGSIASEHIIGVLDYGSADGIPYLVMELVRGQDLRELLAETPRLDERRAVRIVLDACRGLALAHERGLVHRDLKPANICVTWCSDGREVAKVIDFGVAKLRDGLELSEEGTLIGTVGYMAPEQLTDHRHIDARADIYALGVILYQALAGRPPHVGQRSELLYRIVSIDPPALTEVAPDVSPGLSEVVQRALARDRERRYGSIREFARALEPYADAAAAPFDAAPRPSRSPGSPDLGTAVTELESAPTWATLGDSARAHGERSCDRECERDAAGAPGLEAFCRQLSGISPLPSPTRDQHLSQRALVLSVGALVLSVVAMATMFVFVYSQGSLALETGLHRDPSASAGRATLPDPRAPRPGERRIMASASEAEPARPSAAPASGALAQPGDGLASGAAESTAESAEAAAPLSFPAEPAPPETSGWTRASVAEPPAGGAASRPPELDSRSDAVQPALQAH